MSITEELSRLQALHTSGALTDEEFAKAKKAVLQDHSANKPSLGNQQPNARDDSLGKAVNRFVSFQVVMAVIGLIVFLVFFFTIFLPNWNAVMSHFPK